MSKNCVYVGGLDEAVDLETLYQVFGTFGEISSLYFPTSTATSDGLQRNFAFVEFDQEDDARAAIDNMHLSEINGRVIKCNWAHSSNTSQLGSGKYEQTKPVWEQDLHYQQ